MDIFLLLRQFGHVRSRSNNFSQCILVVALFTCDAPEICKYYMYFIYFLAFNLYMYTLKSIMCLCTQYTCNSTKCRYILYFVPNLMNFYQHFYEHSPLVPHFIIKQESSSQNLGASSQLGNHSVDLTMDLISEFLSTHTYSAEIGIV